MRRFLALFLAMIMCFSLIDISAIASDMGQEQLSEMPEENQEPIVEPQPIEPQPTEPQPIEPQPTEPQPTEPQPTEPQPTEPQPTEPQPTEPQPTEPQPTEPQPTEPQPTEEPEKEEPETEEAEGVTVSVGPTSASLTTRMTEGTHDSVTLSAKVTTETPLADPTVYWELPDGAESYLTLSAETGDSVTVSAAGPNAAESITVTAKVKVSETEYAYGYANISLTAGRYSFTATDDRPAEEKKETIVFKLAESGSYPTDPESGEPYLRYGDPVYFELDGDKEELLKKYDFDTMEYTAEMRLYDDSGSTPVYVKALTGDYAGSFFITDNISPDPMPLTGDVTLSMTKLERRGYDVSVTEIGEEYEKTIRLPADVKPEAEVDYSFYIARPEDYIEEEEQGEEKEKYVSKYTYALPLIKIDDEDYYNYKLELIDETEETEWKNYEKVWKVTIPGDDIVGDVEIDANKSEITSQCYPVSFSSVVPTIKGPEKDDYGLVPFSETDMLGYTVKDSDGYNVYYFYYQRMETTEPNPVYNQHPIFKIGDATYHLSPMAEGSSVYKISDITGAVTVTLGYNVSVFGTSKHEEVMIELPSNVAYGGSEYKFAVKHHEKTVNDFQITITIGNKACPQSGAPSTDMVYISQSGDYRYYTIPAGVITDDIVISAVCATDVKSVVIFGADPKYGFGAYEFSYPKDESALVSHKLNLNPYSEDVYFQIVALESGQKMTYSDSNTDCYSITFNDTTSGLISTMGGNPVSVDLSSKSGYDTYGNYHQYYVINNGEAITGDVILKPQMTLKEFNCYIKPEGSVTPSKGLTAEGKVTYRKGLYVSKGSYDRLVFIITKPGYETDEQKVLSSSGTKPAITVSGDTYNLRGGYITGDVTIKALKSDELSVTKKGDRAYLVNLPNNGIATKYQNYSFTTTNSGAAISIKVGSETLKYGKDKGYYREGNTYTINGSYMTDDVVITSLSYYNVYFKGSTQYVSGQTTGVTILAGNTYSFKLSQAMEVTIESGGVKLVKDTDYTVTDNTYFIKADSIVGDITVTIGDAKDQSAYYTYGTGTFSKTKTTDDGTEISYEISKFLTLDECRSMYLIVARAELADGKYMIYDGNKMIKTASYDGYAWLVISEEDEDDFNEKADSLITDLTDKELGEYLQERDQTEKVEIPKSEEINNRIEIEPEEDETEDNNAESDEDIGEGPVYDIVCDINEDGKTDEDDMKLMREMFNSEYTDFEDVPMRSFILADTNVSGNLDMRDAVVLKNHFDEEEEEDEDEDAADKTDEETAEVVAEEVIEQAVEEAADAAAEESIDDVENDAEEEEEELDRHYDFIMRSGGADHVSAEKDDVITVSLSLKFEPEDEEKQLNEMYAFQSEICYDSEILELVEDSIKGVNGVECSDLEIDDMGRRIRVGYILNDETEIMDDEARVLTFNLKVLKEVGNTTLSQESYLVSDEDGMDEYDSDAEELVVTTEKYVEALYNVRFAYMNGDTDDEISVNEGSPINAPEKMMLRDGYEFAGWYTDGGYTQTYDFSQPVNSDLILYAKWDRIQKDNTMIWCILGGALVVTGLVVFLISRKKRY